MRARQRAGSQRFASPKERLFAVELTRAGFRWEYAPRIGPNRVADFRLPDYGLLVEVYSGRGELRKSALANCLIMNCETSRGMRAWIGENLRDEKGALDVEKGTDVKKEAAAPLNQQDAGALFDKVIDLYRGQVWMPADRATWGYSLLAAVTFATYCARQTDHWFIVDLEGATGSAKGEILKVFRRIGYGVRRPTTALTTAQFYLYPHLKRINGKYEDPKTVIYNELHLRARDRDVLAILNDGVSREAVIPRRIDGKQKMLRPWGIKWLVHEGTLPRSFHSLRRRYIRLQTMKNNEYTPALVTDEELEEAVEPLRADLERWHAVNLKPLINKWLHNHGTIDGQPYKLSGDERPIWNLVLAVAEYCDRLDALILALSANRYSQEVNVIHWWRERALPMLKGLDPAGMRAHELLDVMREHFGADIPSLSPKSLGRYLASAIADRKLTWTNRRGRYWRRNRRAPRRHRTRNEARDRRTRT